MDNFFSERVIKLQVSNSKSIPLCTSLAFFICFFKGLDIVPFTPAVTQNLGATPTQRLSAVNKGIIDHRTKKSETLQLAAGGK